MVGLDADGKQVHYIEASGSSTDDKPTEESFGWPIADGSSVLESDTAKVFFFNEAQTDWLEA